MSAPTRTTSTAGSRLRAWASRWGFVTGAAVAFVLSLLVLVSALNSAGQLPADQRSALTSLREQRNEAKASFEEAYSELVGSLSAVDVSRVEVDRAAVEPVIEALGQAGHSATPVHFDAWVATSPALAAFLPGWTEVMAAGEALELESLSVQPSAAGEQGYSYTGFAVLAPSKADRAATQQRQLLVFTYNTATPGVFSDLDVHQASRLSDKALAGYTAPGNDIERTQ